MVKVQLNSSHINNVLLFGGDRFPIPCYPCFEKSDNYTKSGECSQMLCVGAVLQIRVNLANNDATRVSAVARFGFMPSTTDHATVGTPQLLLSIFPKILDRHMIAKEHDRQGGVARI